MDVQILWARSRTASGMLRPGILLMIRFIVLRQSSAVSFLRLGTPFSRRLCRRVYCSALFCADLMASIAFPDTATLSFRMLMSLSCLATFWFKSLMMSSFSFNLSWKSARTSSIKFSTISLKPSRTSVIAFSNSVFVRTRSFSSFNCSMTPCIFAEVLVDILYLFTNP